MGAGLTTWAGGMLEEYSFYVPYGMLTQAAELAKVVFDDAPVFEEEEQPQDGSVEALEEMIEMEGEDEPF